MCASTYLDVRLIFVVVVVVVVFDCLEVFLLIRIFNLLEATFTFHIVLASFFISFHYFGVFSMAISEQN